MKKAIIIFTRIPMAGKTKTRLEPYYSKQECEELHTCFLRDYAKTLNDIYDEDADIFVFYSGDGDINKLEKIFMHNVISDYIEQRGNDIGEKMKNAFIDVFALKYDRIVLVGSDVPTMSSYDLSDAFNKLEVCDFVIAPVEDGGYYLIGMNEMHNEVFQLDKYGNQEVLVKTIKEIKKLELTYHIMNEKFDIDTARDLIKYEKYSTMKKAENSYTYRYIMDHKRISVVIPIYNEMKNIFKLEELIKSLIKCYEIILVDGESSDGTYEYFIDNIMKFKKNVRIIKSKKGRSNQMNIGSVQCIGQILLFLHADSSIDINYYDEIIRVMKINDAACFKIKFDSNKILMVFNSFFSNMRSKYRKIIFGDQGYIINHSVFDEIGGFEEIPIMEDYQLSLELKKHKKKVGMINSYITTSSRRYSNKSSEILKTMCLMFKLRKMYRENIDINIINELYKDVR